MGGEDFEGGFKKGNMDDSKILEEELRQQFPSIKIIKNSKGYNFEFKILSLNVEELDKIHNAIVSKIKSWEQKINKGGV